MSIVSYLLKKYQSELQDAGHSNSNLKFIGYNGKTIYMLDTSKWQLISTDLGNLEDSDLSDFSDDSKKLIRNIFYYRW
jgi:hypothetical protein